MKNNIIIGISFLVCLFIFIPTVHADSGQLYKVDSETLELRDAPDQNANILAELKRGAKVTVFQESYGWGSTFYNGNEAWGALHQLAAVNNPQKGAKERQVQTASSSEIDAAPGESVESAKLYQVKAPVVRLRNAPDNNATIITELNKGAKVSIFQESYGWGKTFYNGKEVWIALYLLDERNKSADHAMSEVNEKADPQQITEGTEKEDSEAESGQKDEDAEVEEEFDEKKESTAKTKEKEENQDIQGKQRGEKTLSGYHFVIDPGHGGKDSGAIRSEVNEKTLALSTGKKVEEQLRDKGASVTLTRTDDTFIPLEERVQISNSTNADTFISLHYNTFEDQNIRGIHTFYYDVGDNQKLADTIQKSLINHTNLNDRRAKQADYKVLTDNQQPALLIELGFISNPEERQLVQTDKYQEKAAKGIVTGLEDYFN
ncbi:N-acetylmuramoyl-L-alanine amidase [Virgibacillus sp. NKC19-16]|uniref:N-acetylmuramoyl-L-alanine amidase n=1 Tax=Virgibacillus salidurans TaxID=2831673 RepID=UPI001F42036F|nr:N-acetylmuramoyl-L-alanine amidase [Virgibacillus sp. NKC19-16]UJL46650.1 N-acetylmuramoyl-L-alanine amidase [Virgibacillus sp. NKC19-16]